jgi:hypothetical protein
MFLSFILANPMLSVLSLYSLIQSMTKSEKRYFRLDNAGQRHDRGYMLLYNFLESKPMFDESQSAALRSLFPGMSLEPARKHLCRVLMKSLRQYEMDKNIEAKLFNLLQDSKILLNRGFLNESAQTLVKAKDLALKNEKFMLLILLAQQELRLETHRQYHGTEEADLIGKHEAISRLLQHEVGSHQHASIYEVLLLRYWKGTGIRTYQELTSLNDLLLEEHYILNSQSLESFQARQVHLLFQSTFMLMTGDSEGSLDTFYALDELFRQHEHLWIQTPVYYIQTLNGILHTLRRMEKYQEMTFFIDRLNALEPGSENLKLTVKSQVIEHRLHAWVNQKEYQKCLYLLEDQVYFEKFLDQLNFNDQAQLLLSISRVWHLTGNFTKALHYVNKILNRAPLLINRSLHVRCQLTYMMIHKSLNNKELLTYELRSYERKLKLVGRTYKTEALVISLLKNWVNHKSTARFHNDLLLIINDPFEQVLISELDLRSWFEKNC